MERGSDPESEIVAAPGCQSWGPKGPEILGGGQGVWRTGVPQRVPGAEPKHFA